MGKRHRRITKKELKKDKFVEEGTKFLIWTRKHKLQVGWIISGICIISIGGWYFYHSIQTRQRRAEYEFSQAIATYGAGYIDQALTQFEDISRLYPRTKSGVDATYWLANIRYFQGKYPEARNLFEKYLTQGKDPIFLPSALLGIADTYLQEGDYFSAAQKYEEVTKYYPKSSISPKAFYQAARCYQALNQPERTKTTLQNLAKTYPSSRYASKAQSLIINLM